MSEYSAGEEVTLLCECHKGETAKVLKQFPDGMLSIKIGRLIGTLDVEPRLVQKKSNSREIMSNLNVGDTVKVLKVSDKYPDHQGHKKFGCIGKITKFELAPMGYAPVVEFDDNFSLWFDPEWLEAPSSFKIGDNVKIGEKYPIHTDRGQVGRVATFIKIQQKSCPIVSFANDKPGCWYYDEWLELVPVTTLKIGDSVRIIDRKSCNYNKIGKIDAISITSGCSVNIDGAESYYTPESLELVPEIAVTFETGAIVYVTDKDSEQYGKIGKIKEVQITSLPDNVTACQYAVIIDNITYFFASSSLEKLEFKLHNKVLVRPFTDCRVNYIGVKRIGQVGKIANIDSDIEVRFNHGMNLYFRPDRLELELPLPDHLKPCKFGTRVEVTGTKEKLDENHRFYKSSGSTGIILSHVYFESGLQYLVCLDDQMVEWVPGYCLRLIEELPTIQFEFGDHVVISVDNDDASCPPWIREYCGQHLVITSTKYYETHNFPAHRVIPENSVTAPLIPDKYLKKVESNAKNEIIFLNNELQKTTTVNTLLADSNAKLQEDIKMLTARQEASDVLNNNLRKDFQEDLQSMTVAHDQLREKINSLERKLEASEVESAELRILNKTLNFALEKVETSNAELLKKLNSAEIELEEDRTLNEQLARKNQFLHEQKEEQRDALRAIEARNSALLEENNKLQEKIDNLEEEKIKPRPEFYDGEWVELLPIDDTARNSPSYIIYDPRYKQYINVAGKMGMVVGNYYNKANEKFFYKIFYNNLLFYASGKVLKKCPEKKIGIFSKLFQSFWG